MCHVYLFVPWCHRQLDNTTCQKVTAKVKKLTLGNETIHKTIHKLYITLAQLLYSPVRYANKMYIIREVSVFIARSYPW